MNPTITIPSALTPLIETLTEHGIRPVLVGGFVRDALLGIQNKDIDIECYGAETLDDLGRVLTRFGTLSTVGKSFGVLTFRLDDLEIDLALPRTETKTGPGHRGFEVETHGRLAFKTAALRRDFTINAIGYDPRSHALLDPYGGLEDLKARVLRCVDPVTFTDDPLRVWRAAQFAARFGLTPDKRLLTLAHKMVSDGELDALPKERVFGELKKLLLKSDNPSVGFRIMDAMHLAPFFPELNALKLIPQSPQKHPEGDVWTHTLLSLDVMASLRPDDPGDALALMLGVLCHDMGKPLTTCLKSGHLSAPNHARVGADPARRFLSRLTDDKRLTNDVLIYVRWHGEVNRLFKTQASDADIMRLATRVRISRLCLIASADHLAFRPEVKEDPSARWLHDNAARLHVLYTPRPALLDGNDLIASGLNPSAAFKPILETAYDAQLEGAFRDKQSGRIWLANYLSDFGKS